MTVAYRLPAGEAPISRSQYPWASETPNAMNPRSRLTVATFHAAPTNMPIRKQRAATAVAPREQRRRSPIRIAVTRHAIA